MQRGQHDPCSLMPVAEHHFMELHMCDVRRHELHTGCRSYLLQELLLLLASGVRCCLVLLAAGFAAASLAT
jgi:hypothetical protein